MTSQPAQSNVTFVRCVHCGKTEAEHLQVSAAAAYSPPMCPGRATRWVASLAPDAIEAVRQLFKAGAVVWWTDEMLDAIEDRASREMGALSPGEPDRFVWATVAGMAETLRKVRDHVGVS